MCDKCWKDGSCCCNCQYQIELFKHPWNKINSGTVSETTNMYACVAEHISEKNYQGTIFEKKHGMCEMHEARNLRAEKLRRILK